MSVLFLFQILSSQQDRQHIESDGVVEVGAEEYAIREELLAAPRLSPRGLARI